MSAKRRLKYLGINIIVIAFLVIVIGKCRNKTAKFESLRNVEYTRVNLESIWTRLGDAEGAIDEECDDAGVEASEFSRNGKYIISGARRGYNLRVWETKTGNMVFEHICDDEIEIVTFDPYDKYILAGGEYNKLLIWQVSDWSLFKTIEFEASVEGLRFSHNDKLLAVGDEAGNITLIDVPTFEKKKSIKHSTGDTAKFFRSDVNSLDFSYDDQYLVSGGIDGKIKIWFLPDLKLIKTIDAHEGSVKSVRVNHKDDCIASASTQSFRGSDNSIKIWDFQSGELLHSLSFPLGIEAVEFSPNGNFLFGGGREARNNNPDQSGKGYIYAYYIPDDFLSEPIRQVYKVPVFRAEYLNFNTTGTHLVSSHEDGTLRLWKVSYK